MAERKQVQSHLRICVTVESEEGFSKSDTICSSEPILSDAASRIMQHDTTGVIAPIVLSGLLSTASYSIHLGERGEVAAMLLATLARDEVVYQEDRSVEHPGFFHVVPFLQQLFATCTLPLAASLESSVTSDSDTPLKPSLATSPRFENILAAKPSVFHDESVKDTSLQEAFADVYMHFNHFIKRGAQGLDPMDVLMLFARNAAFAGVHHSQPGIDLGFVMCKGQHVLRTSTSVFLVQVKNDERYTDMDTHEALFDSMDPVYLGILSPTEISTVPIIRVIMAFAGTTPALECRKSQKAGNFTAYDIWASGLTSDVYPVVGKSPEAWLDILQKSAGWRDIYSGDKAIRELKMAMTPIAGYDDAFRSWFSPARGAN